MNHVAKICVCLFALAFLGACQAHHESHGWKGMEAGDEGKTLDLHKPVGVPFDADLIWFGTGAPEDIYLPAEGTLYVVDDAAGRVLRVIRFSKDNAGNRISFGDEPGYTKSAYYRVYFVEADDDDGSNDAEKAAPMHGGPPRYGPGFGRSHGPPMPMRGFQGPGRHGLDSNDKDSDKNNDKD